MTVVIYYVLNKKLVWSSFYVFNTIYTF